MIYSRLRYKGVDLRVYPKSLTVKQERKVVRTPNPFSGCAVQEVGLGPLTVSGEGEFTGSHAGQDFREVETLFRQTGSGLLQIPGRAPVQAYFTELAMKQQAGPDFVEFAFTFVEDCGGGTVRERV